MTLAASTLATEDLLAIQQLYARYNHAIDSGDATGWAACFTPAGTFTSGASGSFAGTEQLTGFAQGFASRLKARHWTNNLIIDADGDGARGTCYLMLLRLAEGAPASVMATGIYRDEIVRDSGAWKFASRNVVTDA
ncbi:MAG: nuclear transport factor 2 family protein [Dehalococcoidia bacterium]